MASSTNLQESNKALVRAIYGDGDTVIISFDASATAADGVSYRNTYAWYFTMSNERVSKAIAFFDTREFDEFATG